MDWLRRALHSDDLYEFLIVLWMAASPFAIARWVSEFPDRVEWAAFIGGVIGVLVGWLVIGPYYFGRGRAQERKPG
jgi:hypothetical protein